MIALALISLKTRSECIVQTAGCLLPAADSAHWPLQVRRVHLCQETESNCATGAPVKAWQGRMRNLPALQQALQEV